MPIIKIIPSSCKFYIIFVILLAYPLATFAQTLQLSSTLAGGDAACPDALIEFTCVVTGSHRLVWISNEYIGSEISGRQLTFGTDDSQGKTLYSQINDEVFASLVRVGSMELTSRLRILASLNSSVICSDGDMNRNAISFKVPGKV